MGGFAVNSILAGFKEYFPWLLWKTDNSGYVTFCPLDRRLIEDSCENVWDSGQLVLFSPDQLPVSTKFPSLISEIKNGDEILKALWHSNDPAVLCKIDPLGRIVLFNSPVAIDYTLQYLWKLVEKRASQ